MSEVQQVAKARRESAREKYRPPYIRLLLIAEAPPCMLARYFYFEDVNEQDSLFRYVCKGVLGGVSPRGQKAEDLAKLRDAGVYLVDVSDDPIADGAKVRLSPGRVAALPSRCRDLAPERVVLIKSNVYDLAYDLLKREGMNVIDARIPFPGSGQQKKFEEAFAGALAVANFSC